MDTYTAVNRWKRGLGRSAIAVLLLALAWAVIAGRGDAQAPVTVRVFGPDAPVAAGQTFAVTVAVDNVQNLGAYEFEFNFDPAVATTTVNNIQLAPFLSSTGRTAAALRLASSPGRPGTPLFGAYSYGTSDGPSGSGVLATITMSAASPGASQLSLTGLTMTDVLGEEFSTLTMAGNVTVVGSTMRPLYLPLLRRNSSN